MPGKRYKKTKVTTRTEKEFIAAYGSILVEYNLLASKGIF